MQLNAEQLRAFDEQGYVFFPNCFSEEEIALLRAEAENILKLDRQEVWREKTGAPRTAFAAHTFSDVFGLLARHPRLVEPLRQLFGEEVYVHQFKLNAKAAFEGDVWQWHQDYGTWQRDDGMPDARAMNIAVFLDEVMPINGPLLLIPKSHKQGVFAAGHDKLTTSYPLWTLDKETVTRLAAEAEDADRRRHRRAHRQARLGADVPRQSGARLAAQHHALRAQDRLSNAVRLLEPHHQVHAAGMDRAPRFHADPACRRRRTARIRPRTPGRRGINSFVSWRLTRGVCCAAPRMWRPRCTTRPCNCRTLLPISARHAGASGYSTMYTLYSDQRSGNSYKVRLALARLGIPFKLVEIDILQGASRTPEFLAKNPNGHVPLLEVAPNRYLAESNAILWYVAGGTTLAPEDRIDRAEAMQWMFFEQHSLEPNIGAAYFWLALIKGGRDLQQHALEDWMENGYRALGVMEMHLASRRFFVANHFTIADIALYAYTHVANQCDFDLARFRPFAPGSRASRPNPAMWRWTGNPALTAAQ